VELHPDKTRIIEFGRFALENRRARGQGKPYALPTNFVPSTPSTNLALWPWLCCLRRQRQRRRLTWRKMVRVAERWRPSPKLRHPYPDSRVTIPGGSAVR
jgi:hypothetical protein